MLLMTHNIKHVREEMMKKAMIALSAILVAAPVFAATTHANKVAKAAFFLPLFLPLIGSDGDDVAATPLAALIANDNARNCPGYPDTHSFSTFRR